MKGREGKRHRDRDCVCVCVFLGAASKAKNNMYSRSFSPNRSGAASPRPGVRGVGAAAGGAGNTSRSGSLAVVDGRGAQGNGGRSGTPTNFLIDKRDRAIQQLVAEESAALNFLARRGSEAEKDSNDSETDITDTEEAMANAERELAVDAEWKRIQQNTFTR